jgi:hypothetical protein
MLHPKAGRLQRRAVPVALAALLACSSGTGPDPNGACTGPIRVTATNTTTPMVTWSPQCQVNTISFAEPDFGLRALWVVLDPMRGNSIMPPVQYGLVPAGGREQAPAQPMVPGQTYLVQLWVSDSSDVFATFVGIDTLVAGGEQGTGKSFHER